MVRLPKKDQFLRNFSRCMNWEEKYLYLIELGDCLMPIPVEIYNNQYLITDCQSQVWIMVDLDDNGYVQLYGDSNSAIVKGLISILFILYQGLTPNEITEIDVHPFLKELALTQYLTRSRSHGLEAIVRAIRTQVSAVLDKNTPLGCPTV